MTIGQKIPDSEDAIFDRACRAWQQAKVNTPWADQVGERLVPLKLVHLPHAVRGVFAVKATSGERAIWKVEIHPSNPDALRRNLMALEQARQVLSSVSGCGVPQILWSDVDRGLSLTEFAIGDTGRRALRGAEIGFGHRADILLRIGRYCAALHEYSPGYVEPFHPSPFLKQVIGTGAAVRAGKIKIARSRRFLGLCAYLHRAGRRASGLEFRRSQTHGDFHLLNLLITENCVTGVDFFNSDPKPSYLDVARFWNNAGDHFDCTDQGRDDGEAQLSGFAGLPGADWAAFMQGYGSDLAQDPVFHFFFALQLFREWKKKIGNWQDLATDRQAQLERFTARLDWLLAAEPKGANETKEANR